MNIFKGNKKNEHYLIKNLVKKVGYQRDFNFNRINFFLFGLFISLSFFVFSWVVDFKHFSLENYLILLIYPVFIMIAFLLGRWDLIIKSAVVCFIGYYWIFRFDSFFYIIPLTVGAFVSPFIQIVNEWQRALVLRFGKFHKIKGPGLFTLLPFFDSINTVIDLRVKSTDFVAETTLTNDSVSVVVDGLVFWMVWDPEKAILEVENYMDAVVLSSQAALRDAVGKIDLSVLLRERDMVGNTVRDMVDKKTGEWGITIQSIEITDIIIPDGLQEVMSKRAQAEREKEAKILLADGEIEVAVKLHEAAEIYNSNPQALKLKELTVIQEGLKKGNSMLLMPSTLTEGIDKVLKSL